MCGTKESSNQTSSHNNNNKPRSNLWIKWKTQNHKQKIKREEKQKHQEMFNQFGPNWPTLGERLISSIHYQWVLYKGI